MRHIDYGLGVLTVAALGACPADTPVRPRRGLSAICWPTASWPAYEVAERFYEIGSPAGLEETRAFLARRTHARLTS